MRKFCKILKKPHIALFLVSFFIFTGTANAQSVGNDIDLSGCATTVVSGLLADALSSTVASAMPRSIQGGILLDAVALQAAAVAEGTVASAIAVPVNDMAANAQMAVSNVISNADATFNAITKMNLDAVAYGIAQCTLSAMTENTIKWIQGGFTGSPNFAVDTTNLFQNLSDAVLLDLSNQIKGIQTCDFTPNFRFDLANSVEGSAPKRNKLATKIQCPFGPTDIYASQFYGPASRFSWSLFETSLSEGGNAFAVKVATAEEANRRLTDAKEDTERKLSWSNGFADIIDPNNCTYPEEVEIAISDNTLPPAAIGAYQRAYCKTTTPGKIVGDSLMKAIGAKQDRIGFADNMNKIISAFLNEITKEAISGIFTEVNNATPSTGASSNTSPATIYSDIATQIPTSITNISTEPASSVISTSATLNGSISSNGTLGSGNMWFEWGDTTALGNRTASIGYTTGETPATNQYSQTITGLSTSTTYYFRSFSRSVNGRDTYSPIIRNFTTTP